MTKQEVVSFIKEFNSMGGFSDDFIFETLKSLSAKEKDLFMALVNQKMGNDFLDKLKSGEI